MGVDPAHNRDGLLQLAQISPAPLIFHGDAAVARAIADGLEFQAFSAEYVANMLEMRLRVLPEPAALQLTRHSDLLELELPAPDLSRYDKDDEQ